MRAWKEKALLKRRILLTSSLCFPWLHTLPAVFWLCTLRPRELLNVTWQGLQLAFLKVPTWPKSYQIKKNPQFLRLNRDRKKDLLFAKQNKRTFRNCIQWPNLDSISRAKVSLLTERAAKISIILHCFFEKKTLMKNTFRIITDWAAVTLSLAYQFPLQQGTFSGYRLVVDRGKKRRKCSREKWLYGLMNWEAECTENREAVWDSQWDNSSYLV